MIRLYVILVYLAYLYVSLEKIRETTQRDEIEAQINENFKQSLLNYRKKMEIEQSKPRKINKAFEDFKYNEIKKIQAKAVIPARALEKFQTSENTSKKWKHRVGFTQLNTNRPWPKTGDPDHFFNTPYTKNIHKIPLQGAGEVTPWSGTYWPMLYGITSVRYCNGPKNTMGQYDPSTGQLITQYTYEQSVNMYHEPEEYQSIRPQSKQFAEKYVNDYFSPAEKYDLLVGDLDFTLTNNQKDAGKKFLKQNGGNIPSWFGICHGWSPAAYMVPQPKRPVTLRSITGLDIQFLPDDVKALSSLFLANANVYTNFVGEPCRVAPPKTPIADPATGLWLEADCAAVNPGTLVIVYGNQMGIQRKNFVTDYSQAEDQIWNQPTNSYSLRWFNVITNQFSSYANDVKVPIENIRYSPDKFLNFISRMASPKTRSFVGVLINITYTVETQPEHALSDTTDATKTGTFEAALELDENDDIVGGEWKYNDHPNFLWKIDETYPVQGCCDEFITTKYDGKTITPEMINWARASSTKGQVLKTIVGHIWNESGKNITENWTLNEQIAYRWNFLFN